MRNERAGKIISIIKNLFFVAVVYSNNMCLAQAHEATLNHVQRDHLNMLINHQLRTQSERDYVNKSWTEAQRVAEFICRPLAQHFIQQKFAGVDKVILDQGPKNTQHLMSANLLAGNGQYRIGNDWTPFHYECGISEQTGESLDFRLLKRELVPMAPGPVILGKGEP